MQTLYPTPKSHVDQVLIFSLREAFHNQFDDLINEEWGKENTVPLRLDDLRTCIEEATWPHLIQKCMIDNDDNSV